MKIDVLGVKIDALTKDGLLSEIRTRLQGSESTFIVTPYSESIVAAQKDLEFRNILNSADIALPDGIGILWAAKYLELRIKNHESWIGNIWPLIYSLLSIIFNPSYIRHPIPEKISGSEFVWDLAELASKNNFSIFLLGGFGNTPGRVGEKLKKKFPDLKIAGMLNENNPSFEALTAINNSNTDILFVALGPIKQEKWIYENLPKLRVKLAIGLGGTFDYLAGKRPPAPKIWAGRGLEWLWRLLTQPWRIWRILKGVGGLIWYCFKIKR